MVAADHGAESPRLDGIPIIVIPEVRDYQRINSELIVRLDEGHPVVRLTGADGHRLLVSGIAGPWNATVEVEGRVGPEIGFALNAPGLVVVCRGDAADGAGSGLKAGLLAIQGSAGNAVGYAQKGGIVVVTENSGHRAGLNHAGGLLVLFGKAGRRFGERQSGGTIVANLDQLGPHAGHARRGGRSVSLVDETTGELTNDGECVSLFQRLKTLNLLPPR